MKRDASGLPGFSSPPPDPVRAAVPESSRPTSGKAIAALVLGICSFIPWMGVACALAAIVLGALARKETGPAGQGKGSGMATAGIVLGILGLLMHIVLGLIVFVLFQATT